MGDIITDKELLDFLQESAANDGFGVWVADKTTFESITLFRADEGYVERASLPPYVCFESKDIREAISGLKKMIEVKTDGQ